MLKVAVIGLGFVGKAIYKLLETNEGRDFELLSYTRGDDETKKESVKNSDIAFICVGTPMKEDKTCDLSQMREVLSWLDAGVAVVKSTVPPGTCEQLAKETGKIIVHNPEFLTERKAFEDMRDATRTVLGGDKKHTMKVCRLYQKIYDHSMQYVFCTTRMSEMVKYVTNAFFTTKVAFVNQVYDICNAEGLDYDELREIWLLEPRMTRSHTLVTEERGYGGHCFPKDLNALIFNSQDKCDVNLLKEIWNYNCKIRKEFNGKEYV